MRRISNLILSGLFLVMLPALAVAQSDLCMTGYEPVPNEARAEQLRIQAAERAQRESDRRAWDVKMFSVKNVLGDATLRALCIFRVEVINQGALHLVQVRAPKELMPAIEDAVKRLDVPSVAPKGVELTGYILVAMEPAGPQIQPLPAALQPVANQLKSILPNGTLGLADTFVARGVDRQSINLSGNTTFQARVSLREGGDMSVIRLDNLIVTTRETLGSASFQTSVDVPVGTQVVIGKATPRSDGPLKAVILVINGRILE
jgi:hypothetical protein